MYYSLLKSYTFLFLLSALFSLGFEPLWAMEDREMEGKKCDKVNRKITCTPLATVSVKQRVADYANLTRSKSDPQIRNSIHKNKELIKNEDLKSSNKVSPFVGKLKAFFSLTKKSPETSPPSSDRSELAKSSSTPASPRGASKAFKFNSNISLDQYSLPLEQEGSPKSPRWAREEKEKDKEKEENNKEEGAIGRTINSIRSIVSSLKDTLKELMPDEEPEFVIKVPEGFKLGEEHSVNYEKSAKRAIATTPIDPIEVDKAYQKNKKLLPVFSEEEKAAEKEARREAIESLLGTYSKQFEALNFIIKRLIEEEKLNDLKYKYVLKGDLAQLQKMFQEAYEYYLQDEEQTPKFYEEVSFHFENMKRFWDILRTEILWATGSLTCSDDPQKIEENDFFDKKLKKALKDAGKWESCKRKWKLLKGNTKRVSTFDLGISLTSPVHSSPIRARMRANSEAITAKKKAAKKEAAETQAPANIEQPEGKNLEQPQTRNRAQTQPIGVHPTSYPLDIYRNDSSVFAMPPTSPCKNHHQNADASSLLLASPGKRFPTPNRPLPVPQPSTQTQSTPPVTPPSSPPKTAESNVRQIYHNDSSVSAIPPTSPCKNHHQDADASSLLLASPGKRFPTPNRPLPVPQPSTQTESASPATPPSSPPKTTGSNVRRPFLERPVYDTNQIPTKSRSAPSTPILSPRNGQN